VQEGELTRLGVMAHPAVRSPHPPLEGHKAHISWHLVCQDCGLPHTSVFG
jgi:hypothetical protein